MPNRTEFNLSQLFFLHTTYLGRVLKKATKYNETLANQFPTVSFFPVFLTYDKFYSTIFLWRKYARVKRFDVAKMVIYS